MRWWSGGTGRWSNLSVEISSECFCQCWRIAGIRQLCCTCPWLVSRERKCCLLPRPLFALDDRYSGYRYSCQVFVICTNAFDLVDGGVGRTLCYNVCSIITSTFASAQISPFFLLQPALCYSTTKSAYLPASSPISVALEAETSCYASLLQTFPRHFWGVIKQR